MSQNFKIGRDGMTEFQAMLVKALIPDAAPTTRKPGIRVQFTDPFLTGTDMPTTAAPVSKDEAEAHAKAVSEVNPLVKSVLNVLNGAGNDSIERLAFEASPNTGNVYSGVWKRKLKLLPDEVLKRISIQDDLVAAIVNTRSNQLAAFGRPQPDRFSTGFRIEPSPGHMAKLTPEDKKALQKRIAEVEAQFLTCGSTTGWHDQDSMNLSQFLFVSARNAVVFGRVATEIIYTDDPSSAGGKKFHSFRPIDAGTIFRAAPYKEQAQAVRDEALHLLSNLRNKKLVPERFVADEYVWVQVIEGRPVQAFTPRECLVYNFYPTTDIELDGYPVTPLDTVITAVTTHINIGTMNKLFFQNGRAARGMIVIKSDDVDEKVISFVRQQFNASINSVGNSFRLPVFSVGTDDEINWFPIDSTGAGRDMEFQYLSDTNARVILSAFQMSPEELPGYAHLSRGTNSQALSESSSEYKLEAARDVGIRPLLGQFQNMLNTGVLPVLAPDLAVFCSIKFVGLDAETAEKESLRLQQDQAVHMTMDEVLEKVEKEPIGRRFGGQFLLNPQWQQVLDKYILVGDILEHFFGIEGAAQDPRFQYVNNPLWFQWQQQRMAEEQAKAAQAQGAPPPGSDGGGGDGGGGGDSGGGDGGDSGGDSKSGGDSDGKSTEKSEEQGDLSRSVDQLAGTLTKSEKKLPPSKRALLLQQRQVVESLLKGYEEDAKIATKEILDIVQHHTPARK